jgi:Methyltransferase small domain
LRTHRAIIDENGPELCVEAEFPNQAAIKATLNALQYLDIFLANRLKRSMGYVAVQDSFNPNMLLILENTTARSISNFTGVPKPPREIAYNPFTHYLSCSCPDFHKQLDILPQHPWLWDQMKQQPICKHLIRAVLDYPALEVAIAHIPSGSFQAVIQAAPQHRQKPYLPFQTPGDRPFDVHQWQGQSSIPKGLKARTVGQLRVLHQTTQCPEGWVSEFGVDQERYEQLRCQLHYHWAKVTPQDRIAYLEDLILKLELPELYPSPPPVIGYLLNGLPLQPGCRVLECAAGRGDVALALLNQCADIKLGVIEIQPLLRELLRLKGLRIVAHDFLTYAQSTSEEWDVVVTNPPFRLDTQFAQAAEPLITVGGMVRMIAGSAVLVRTEEKFVAFRQWLKQVQAIQTRLPARSFVDSDRSTPVGTVMIEVHRAKVH